jgi:hypothetical protein
MMRELTLANAMQNIRVMKYLYMAIVLGVSPAAISTTSQSLGNVSYLTLDWRRSPATRQSSYSGTKAPAAI